MIEHKLSTCLRQVRDDFARHCERGVMLTPSGVRHLVSLLAVYATAAERLEGVTVPRTVGEIITLHAGEYTRTVPVEVTGEVS